MLENLRPVANENSLRQVIATVFAQSPLINPLRFKQYLPVLNSQKFELMQTRSFSVNVANNAIKDSNNTVEDKGFRISNYVDGRLNTLLQVEQVSEKQKDITKFSYCSYKYPQWNLFKDAIIKNFSIISSEDNPFVSAISLNYINEFQWIGNDDIDIANIFNKDANFISANLFASQNSAFLISTEKPTLNYKAIERLEVIVSKSNQIIQTNSQLVFELKHHTKFKQAIDDGSLSQYLEDIHTEIKNTLRKLFTEQVKQKINLL